MFSYLSPNSPAVLPQDTYMIQKYGQINTSLGRIKRMYAKKAVPEGVFSSMILVGRL